MSPDLDAPFEPARRLADAVLYEGYVLYPYRASARKNQLRWQFGVLAPRGFSESDGSEPWSMQTECVAEVGAHCVLHVRVRGLQVQARTLEEASGDPDGLGPSWRPTPQLEVDGRLWTGWDEAVEHHFDLPGVALDRLRETRRAVDVEVAGGTEVEVLSGASGRPSGRVQRRRWPISLRVTVRATPIEGPYHLTRLHVAVANVTAWGGAGASRDEVVRHSLVAAHSLLAIEGGTLISQLDPPEFARSAVAGCHSVGTFPVLAGPDGQRDLMLSSPIILYDHAQVAPESPGDFCDATEIDEILALRVMTLTDDEKREARATDPRAAAIVDRCDTIPDEVFGRLHGAVRSLQPASAWPERAEPAGDQDPGLAVPWWDPGADASVDPWRDTIRIGDTAVAKGSRVRLRLRPGQPGGNGRRADAHDLFLAGRSATVQAVFSDVDGDQHVAVTVDDDPGADLYESGGRFLYFHPDEIEPVESRP